MDEGQRRPPTSYLIVRFRPEQLSLALLLSVLKRIDRTRIVDLWNGDTGQFFDLNETERRIANES